MHVLQIDGRCVQEPEKNIFVVAVYTIVICVAVFLVAMGYMIYIKMSGADVSKDPVSSAHFLVSLVVLFMTAYQCIISAMVLVQWLSGRYRSNIYIISMWYMSHLSILVVYWILFIIEFSTSMVARRYFIALFVTTFTIAFQGVFTYFVVVTYRYLKTTG